MCSVHCAVCSVHCLVCSVQCSVQSAECRVQSAEWRLQCAEVGNSGSPRPVCKKPAGSSSSRAGFPLRPDCRGLQGPAAGACCRGLPGPAAGASSLPWGLSGAWQGYCRALKTDGPLVLYYCRLQGSLVSVGPSWA